MRAHNENLQAMPAGTTVPGAVGHRPFNLAAAAGRMAGTLRWHRIALVGVLLLSAFLGFFRLDREGYSNLYYAATVRSMLTNWHNFFYASYDPGGFVTVDKPPLGLWIQAASAWLFGFHGWSLLLPQVLAGILSVVLLYHLVRRAFGPVAGLLAALALAVAPINVATSRNNTMDSLLVLALLVAAWAVSRAAEAGRLRWLLLCACMVGLGFNIKMLQAYLVLPAFGLLYLVAAPVRWWKKLSHLALATAVLLAVSLSWAVAVDLTPPDRRPYIGGSTNNTVMDLITGYNGLGRLTGQIGHLQHASPQAKPQQPPPSGGQAQGMVGQGGNAGGRQMVGASGQGVTVSIAGENGDRGPLRLLNQQLAGQIGWLLPLAVLGLLVAGWQTRPRLPLDRRHQALLLWGMWLLTQVVFFSIAGFWHRYYLVVLSPAIAALVGAGLVALWHDYRQHRRRGWLLPAALLGTAALHAYILADYPDWSRRLLPFIGGMSLVAAASLVALRVMPRLRMGRWSVVAATIGIFALLVAPAAWAAMPVWNAPGDMLPVAGPREHEQPAGLPSGGQKIRLMGSDPSADPRLVSYLRANRGQAKFLVATLYAGMASPIILSTGEPVMALGGFGADPILTTAQLADLVARGDVRFFLIQQMGGPDAAGDPSRDHSAWVRAHCKQVPAQLWQSTTSDLQPAALYDCGSASR